MRLILLIIILTSFAYSISSDNAITKANELYLISPFDSNEMPKNTAILIECQKSYHIIDSKDAYLIISDSNPNEYVEYGKAKEVIDTYLFFNNLDLSYLSTDFVSNLNTLISDVQNYQYNLRVIKLNIDDSDFKRQIDLTLDDLNDSAKLSGDLQSSIEKVKSEESSISCNLKKEITENLDSIKSTANNITNSISKARMSVIWLRDRTLDLNIDDYRRQEILNELNNISSNLSEYEKFNSSLVKSIGDSQNVTYENKYADLWSLRIKRSLVLEKYLKENSELDKATRSKNLKDLFDYIFQNKYKWKSSKVPDFERNYNEFFDLYSKEDYLNASNKLDLLRTLALSIHDGGLKENLVSENESNAIEEESNYTLWYIAAGLTMIIVGLRVAQGYFKSKKDSEKEDLEQPI